MAQAQRKFNRETAASGDPSASAERLRETISTLSLAATNFLPKAKVEATVGQWLAGVPRPEDEDECLRFFGNAALMAMALALFTPSLSGQTAIDRFARQHKPTDSDEVAAIEALQRSRFRLLRLEVSLSPGAFQALDLVTGDRLHLIDGEILPACVGLSIAARICPIKDDYVVTVGPITPLDDLMLDLARQSIRPGGRGLAAQRCAETLYRHAARFGVSQVIGLNATARDAAGTFPFGPEDGPLHQLAFTLAASGAETTAAQMQQARALSGSDDIIDAIIGLAAARILGKAPLAAAYETLALIQMETAERRAAAGLRSSLDSVEAAIGRMIAAGSVPPSARDLFAGLRRRVRVAAPGRKEGNVDLDKVLGRIKALREKTVDQGCTEQEALAAAEKIAELLDRYGLSLSEVELKSQSCEGTGIETGRKRYGPIDTCIPVVGGFCDCRVWSEKSGDGEIRYIFFGLPADVAGARYLYDLVERAFETETQRFKASPLYEEHHSSERRSATNSFQTGLAHGISGKLRALRAERESAMKTSTGRDLVPLKASLVEDELSKLGMTFKRRSSQTGKRVLREAYSAGQEAGDKFEYQPGIEEME
ncbi:MAG: hypothetical protein QOJ54_3654 [Aliidongia sp.]|nr:hypothetical protein [Aliidongia sp.]